MKIRQSLGNFRSATLLGAVARGPGFWGGGGGTLLMVFPRFLNRDPLPALAAGKIPTMNLFGKGEGVRRVLAKFSDDFRRSEACKKQDRGPVSLYKIHEVSACQYSVPLPLP